MRLNEGVQSIPAVFKKSTGTLKKFQSFTGLVLILFLAVILSPRQHGTGRILFLTPENLSDIFRQVSENGIIAIGMTFIILTSGIDLSVGSLLALAATLCAKILTQMNPSIGQPLHIFLAIFLPLMLTTGFGALYGLLISKLNIQPFIITLAGMIGLRGFARFLTNNANIDIGFGDDISAVFANLISPKPVVITTFVVIAVIMSIILGRTVFGLRVKSIGDNSIGSRYAGIPVTKTLLFTYALSGLLTGVAGVLHAAQNHQGSPNDGVSYELDAIAAVVIGGTKMTGGKGSIVGTIIGVFIMGILTNTFRLKGVDINIEMMAKAVIIIVAVWLQQPRKARSKG
ncbi:MAG: ABC transporter permease [Spirochaetales bacterium]|nr:ABC transporter permease [Spirochaetales bacterium]